MRHFRALLLLALGYWRRRSGRALLMVAGVAAGIALLGAVLLVNDALMRTYSGWARGVVGWAELEVRAVAEHGFSRNLAARIEGLPGVSAAAPVVERRSYLFKEGAQLAVNVRGVDPVAEVELRPLTLVAGRALEPGDRQVTLLSYAAALALDAGAGSDVELLTPEGLETLRVVGVFHPLGDERAPQERAALMTLAQAQALFEGGRPRVTRVDVATAGRPVEEVERAIDALVGDEAVVVRARHAATELAAASSGLRYMLLLAGVLAVVAATLLISVYVRAMVDERWPDLRLLHALGVPRRVLRRWLVAEVGFLALLGALPGVPLAAPAAGLLMRYLPGGLLAPFASSFASPRLAGTALVTPAAALLLAAALAAALAALLFRRLFGRLAARLRVAAGAPLWARLAAGFLEQRRGQAAIGAAALTLTLAGLVGIHGVADASRRSLADWLDAAVTWDLRVAAGPATQGRSVTLPHAALAQVAALPGVAEVSAERQVTVASRGRSVTIIALGGTGANLGNRLRVVQAADLGGSTVPLDLRSGRSVALSVALASRLALEVGDELPLGTQGGESVYTVVALVDDSASRLEAAYIGLEQYVAAWGDDGVDSLTVRLTPGAEAASVARAVSAGGRAKVPLHVTLAGAYRAELLAGVAAAYRGARVVVLIAVLVALAGLLGSGLVASWQLEPELALLRALGAPRRLAWRVLALKLALTAAVGAAAGALLGTLLSRRLASTLRGAAAPLEWRWPLDAYATVVLLLALTAGLAVVLLGPRSGASPARRPALGQPRSARRP